jgi:hypothetical protein
VLGTADLIHANPSQAQTLLQDAWAALMPRRIVGVVNQAAIDQQRARVSAGLDHCTARTRDADAGLRGAGNAGAAHQATIGPDGAAVCDRRDVGAAHRP